MTFKLPILYFTEITKSNQSLSISDNFIFPFHKSIKSNYINRENSCEILAGLKFFLASYNKDHWEELGISAAKDLKAHKGYYLTSHVKIKLTQFDLLNKKLDQHAVVRIGLGDNLRNASCAKDHSEKALISIIGSVKFINEDFMLAFKITNISTPAIS